MSMVRRLGMIRQVLKDIPRNTVTQNLLHGMSTGAAIPMQQPNNTHRLQGACVKVVGVVVCIDKVPILFKAMGVNRDDDLCRLMLGQEGTHCLNLLECFGLGLTRELRRCYSLPFIFNRVGVQLAEFTSKVNLQEHHLHTGQGCAKR